ncbi:DUF2165 domain-containing protein [Allokutzneria sp. A3M-2-11 16]|uniref:DUF2165 domain-containing protein n=1 Tax=Allokutzneria sp. A3M-2-11 16 TaxID=2962043 RepID=UPI0020B7A896|nr:DUF2165 domain-containing protein [Allokutzneria sp. A3M-2-11 16]MCP3801676.1 DUF2165 domain-containing protein [Allokutzneria sp. A3M-2-11 16]
MNVIGRFGTARVALAALTGVTALYFVLIVLGNVTDYGTNEQFVVHVLAMDTTFNDPDVMWRAITSPAVVTIAYVLIIVWEAVTAAVLVAAFVAWLRRGREETARRLAVVGWVMAVLLFGGGFIAIGGEWFQMWQSSKWNGVEAAFRNVVIASIGLVIALGGARTRD